MIKHAIVFGAMVAALLGFGTPAQAALITFGTGAGEVNPGAVNSYSTTVGGTHVTVNARPSGVFTTTSGGIGIDGPGYEDDEIESPEYLQILFNAPATNVTLDISKFFAREPGYFFGTYNETGYVSVNGGASTKFVATSTSGQYQLDLSAFGAISTINLAGIGRQFSFTQPFFRSHEFSLKKVEFTPAAVPEPLSMALLGLGLASVGYRMRRRA